VATIRVDLDRRIGLISPLIYGSLIEHIDRCIYGGILDASQAEAGECVPREDTLAAVRALQVPILRWPGGNFASGYHWLDGVGPIGERPRRLNLGQNGEESNVFGTAEFIRYCRLISAEPYICLNLGTGTVDEAQAWVEYCNGRGDSYWANLRRRHGYAEPFDVRFWGLGNELYGAWQVGAKSDASDYAKVAKEAAKMMRLTDPSVALASCGEIGYTDWDARVIAQLGRDVRYHSIHIYTGNADYYQNVFMPHHVERALRIAQALIDKTRYEQQLSAPLTIALDEWNVMYRARPGWSEEPYDLADALAVATFFNIFHRWARTVEIANMAQLVNALAPITTTDSGVLFRPTYWPCLLYRRHCREVALDVWLDCETYDHLGAPMYDPDPHMYAAPYRAADLGPFPYLDVSATVDAACEHLTLAVVNRHREEDIETMVDIRDADVAPDAMCYEVNGPGVHSANSAQEPNCVGVTEQRLFVQPQFTYVFPAHSITLLTLRVSPHHERR